MHSSNLIYFSTGKCRFTQKIALNFEKTWKMMRLTSEWALLTLPTTFKIEERGVQSLFLCPLHCYDPLFSPRYSKFLRAHCLLKLASCPAELIVENSSTNADMMLRLSEKLLFYLFEKSFKPIHPLDFSHLSSSWLFTSPIALNADQYSSKSLRLKIFW